MTLPISRNTTHTPNAPVLSVDLNAIQDCIVGGKRGSVDEGFRPLVIDTTGGTVFAASNSGHGLDGSEFYAIASGGSTKRIPIPMAVGDRLLALKVDALGDGVADATWTVYKQTRAQLQASTTVWAGTCIQTAGVGIVDTNRAAAWGVLDLSIAAGGSTCALGDVYWALVAIAGGGTWKFGPAMFKTTDRP